MCRVTALLPLKLGDSYQGATSVAPTLAKKRNGFSRCFMGIPTRYSKSSHIIATARTFFVTSSTDGKRSLLQSDRAAELFVRVLYEYHAQGKYRVHEFVVMPDHFHLLLTVGSELSIERAVQFIKGGFAFRAGRELGFAAPVWQKGFSEVRVLDGGAYGKIVEYIRNNPVRRGLVGVASEFLYSSANTKFELDPAPQGLKPVECWDAVRRG